MSEEFFIAYVVAALWTTNLCDREGEDFDDTSALDAGKTIDDVDADLLVTMRRDCEKFWAQASALIEDSDPICRCSPEEYAGHNFWLTRNGLGCGFGDGDWGRYGDALEAIAEAFSEVWIHVGDDGRIYG